MVKMRVTVRRVAVLTSVLTLGAIALAAAEPGKHLRLDFPATGAVVRPEIADASAWSLDLRLTGVSFDGRFAPVGPPRLVASEERADYDFGTARVVYVETPSGVRQKTTIAAPERRGEPGAVALVGVEFSIGGNLTPVKVGYSVKLVDANGDAMVRLGPVDAKDANGTKLVAGFELVDDHAGGASGVRVVVQAIDPVYPIEIEAAVASATEAPTAAPTVAPHEIVGVPVTLGVGITETVEQIMERERLSPPPLLMLPRETHREMELDQELNENPDAPPPLSNWPPILESPTGRGAVVEPPNLPQTVGTSFKGIGISDTIGFIPPDTMGDVGPTQILMHSNGRIKVFSKTGTLGGLNASDTAFWASLGTGISDPQVRYDRLSGRWFVIGITLEMPNNRIGIAVSSGATITNQASFTFYQFNIGTPAPADASYWCDYPGFGVDANALYVGCDMFGGAEFHTSAFVIRKSSVTGGGPMVVTGFPFIGSSSIVGPFAPRGVDNDDPTATAGFIIGTDLSLLGRINIRKVSTPGGTPTMGTNTILSVSNTNVLDQSAMGSTTAINAANARLFAASIHKNKITGVTSLWTSHSVETDTSCTPANGGNNRRLGAKWYEIGNLTGTPTITRFGTLCTTAAGSDPTSNTERGFIYPTVVESGQGHMALSASYSSATEFVGVAAAGRFRTDPTSGTRAPETIVLTGTASYNVLDPTRNRWGDYSATDIDPVDDQTIWTFQEYVDGTNAWAVRAVQLKGPGLPIPLSASNQVCAGVAAAPVTITGTDNCVAPTCTNGLCTGGGPCPEFFDPGPDTGGPGYANRLQATVTGGVTVNSVSLVIPASPTTQRVLSVALSLNTTAATPGTKTVAIVNPDRQPGSNVPITLVANRAPVSNAGGPYSSCQNGSVVLNGTGSSEPDAACGDSIVLYEWDLNNDGTYDVTGATPTVTWAQLTALGLGVGSNTIKLRVTDAHGPLTATATGSLVISAEGTSCSDGNGCTQTDTCQSGVCTGANPVICTASDQCHVAGVCNTGTGVCSNPNATNGTACNDSNACTQTDTCQTGVCTGGNPVNCSDGNPCTSDLCDQGTGACSNPNVVDGSACTDGNACTQTDTCQSGACTGGNPKVCTPLDQCHVAGVCNTGTGVCSNPTAGNGTACNDGNLCTQTDTCQTGICTGSNPVVCTASDQCHSVGVCVSGTGQCTNPNATNGTGCNDLNACTQTDTCQNGVCTGANPVNCNDGNSCTTDSCDTGTGQCGNAVLPDNTACNDADATTCGDICGSGTCAGHPVAEPTAIDASVTLAKTPTDSTITWTDAPGPYAVYRGSKAGGASWAYNHTCLAPGVVATSATDTAVPSPGTFFYYLVTRYNECRESIPGTDGQSNPIPNAAPCPAP